MRKKIKGAKLNIRLPHEQKAALEAMAAQRSSKLSVLIRDIIEDAIAHEHETDLAPLPRRPLMEARP